MLVIAIAHPNAANPVASPAALVTQAEEIAASQRTKTKYLESKEVKVFSQMTLTAKNRSVHWGRCLLLGINKLVTSTAEKGETGGADTTRRDRQAQVGLAQDKEGRVMKRQDQTNLVWAGQKEA